MHFESEDSPFQAEFTPDGSRLVVLSGSASEDAQSANVQVYDAKSGDSVNQLVIPTNKRNVWITSDGLRVVAYTFGSLGNQISIYDPVTGKVEAAHPTFPSNKPPIFSPDGWHAALELNDGTLELWDVKKGASVGQLSSVGYFLPHAV